MLTESEKEAIPRIIMVNSNNKLWRQTIAKAIDIDASTFKSDNYVITCRRYLNDELEQDEFKGSLKLSLHNALTHIDDTDNMIISVENLAYKYLKGMRLQKSIKLVYIVLQS